MYKPLRFFYTAVFFSAVSIAFWSCSGNTKSELEQEAEKLDSNKSNLININGTLFCIPSPLQTSMLLKQSGAKYNKTILNPAANISKYSTSVKKALNLGVYGADLGYVILYQQTQDALAYMSILKKLGDDVGISGAFDEALLKRFEKNLSVQDSLMAMSGEAFRNTDAFLKNNDRMDASALIVAGGWIESVYFISNYTSSASDKSKIIQRLGEQKSTLDNLIKMLTPYYQQEGYTEFIDALTDLASDFDQVEMKYTYVKPEHDEANKITTIKSTSSALVAPEVLTSIINKITKLRNSVTQ
jgi:hypothetical protein